MLHYIVTGAIGELRLPPRGDPVRADGLWGHTCFEAFVGTPDAGYTEFNFAPSTSWAAYRFDSYRSGMRDAEGRPPRIGTRAAGGRYVLRAALDLPGGGPWRLGLCAVIEEKGGGKSYWALAHPPGAPDFHHDACFALELAAPGRS